MNKHFNPISHNAGFQCILFIFLLVKGGDLQLNGQTKKTEKLSLVNPLVPDYIGTHLHSQKYYRLDASCGFYQLAAGCHQILLVNQDDRYQDCQSYFMLYSI